MIDRPVFEELAKIQKDIGLPPSTEDSDYDKCRAYNNSFRGSCNKKSCKSEIRNKITVLLIEFQHMTECDETDGFYDKMKEFITLTYCFNHRIKAITAFTKWKTERMTAASNRISTLATRTMSFSEAQDIWYDAKSEITSTLPAPDIGSSENNEPVSNLCIEERMENLNINTNPQATTGKMGNGHFSSREELKEKLKALGTVILPSENAEQNYSKIQRVIKVPLSPNTMAKEGIVYVLEHNNIPGIFKIGFSEKSAQQRHGQYGNCYAVDTNVLYKGPGKWFAGARQAERIAHAVLHHKNIQVRDCPHCKGKKMKGKQNNDSHKEWFHTSREDALATVEVVEMWLQMPAYIPQGKLYMLSPKAESIFQLIFGFSTKELKKRIHNNDGSHVASDIFPVGELMNEIQQIKTPSSSPPTTESGPSRDSAGTSRTADSNQRHGTGRYQLRVQQLNIHERYNYAAGAYSQSISMMNQELNIEIRKA